MQRAAKSQAQRTMIHSMDSLSGPGAQVRASKSHCLTLQGLLAFGLVQVTFLASRGVADDDTLTLAASNPQSTSYWCRPENDGANCLYLQLRVLGYQERYETYLAAVRRYQHLDLLNGLAAAERDLVYDLVPARLTLADIETVSMRFTAYFERHDESTGYFALIVGPSDQNVVVLPGGSTTIEQVRRDTFRRT